MGIYSAIQHRVSGLLASNRVERNAGLKCDHFLATAAKRKAELHGAIADLKSLATISKRIGADTEKRIDDIKARSLPYIPHQQNGLSANKSKISRANALKARCCALLEQDNSGYSELFAEAQVIRDRYQSSQLVSRMNEAKVNAIGAIGQCEAVGAYKTAERLMERIDEELSSIEDARDAVISQFRSASVTLGKNDPQAIITAEIKRQEFLVEAASRLGERAEHSDVRRVVSFDTPGGIEGVSIQSDSLGR